MYDTRNSNLLLCDYLEGWDRVGGGGEFQEGVRKQKKKKRENE